MSYVQGLPLNLPFWHERCAPQLGFGIQGIWDWKFVICNLDPGNCPIFQWPIINRKLQIGFRSLLSKLGHYGLAYSFSLRYSVVFPMPSSRAATILSPFTCTSAFRMVCFSSSAMGTMPLLGWLIPIESTGAL